MILSESEKNRIKGMYGLVTESESAPPPNESVLIAKKNPFKYDEYKDARRFYNSELKDGDLFFKINDTKDFINFVYEYNKKMATDFVKDLIGKKIRLEWRDGTDRIYEFIDLKCVDGDYDDYQTSFDIKMKDDKGEIVTSEMSMGRYGINMLGTKTSKLDDFMKPIGNKLIKTNAVRHSVDAFLPSSKLHLAPDEYFEIREIKREQTDF